MTWYTVGLKKKSHARKVLSCIVAITRDRMKRVRVCVLLLLLLIVILERGMAWVFWESDYLRIYRFVFVFSVHWKTGVNDQRSWREVENFTLFLASPPLIHVVHHVRKTVVFFPFSDGKFHYYLHHWPSRKQGSIDYQFVLTVLTSLARLISRLSSWRWSLTSIFWAVLLCFLYKIWSALCQTTNVIPSKTECCERFLYTGL